MIIDGRNLTGKLEFDGNLWLANCVVKDAQIIVSGDLYVEQQCLFDSTSFTISGDLILKSRTVIDGPIDCRLLAAHEPFHTSAPLKARKVLVRGESHFTDLSAREVVLYGSSFANNLLAEFVNIDGDLIAHTVCADYVTVSRGSLLVKGLHVKQAEATIIGNYSNERLNEDKYRFQWVRPMLEGAEPVHSTIEEMKQNGLLVLKHYTNGIPLSEDLYKRVENISQCGDFAVLYEDLHALLVQNYDLLVPSVKQFVDCIEKNGFPGLWWRF